jgi:hypothetical protein
MNEVTEKVKRDARRSTLTLVSIGILLLLTSVALFTIGISGVQSGANAFEFRGAIVFLGAAIAAAVAGTALVIMSPIRYVLRMRSFSDSEGAGTKED